MTREFENPVRGQDTRLFELVFQRIQKSPDRSIPFSEFMRIALYDEKDGYYARPESRTVGRGGDFYTSVSVGECFGFLLSQQIQKVWEESFDLARPLVIVEQGAHDGQLALDILAGLEAERHSEICYRIVDPRPGTRDWLKERFRETKFDLQVEVVASLDEARAEEGIFLCNELLDAFPFRRLRFNGKKWEELQVGMEEGSLVWTIRSLPDELGSYAEELGSGFEEGYTTEICPALKDWLVEVAALFEKGQWWLIDYGHESEDYFAPHRKGGTYRCYRDHRASEDPFLGLGETDITAHVNFTHVRKAAEDAGLLWKGLTDQHHFLIEAAKDWLLSIEGQAPDKETAKRLRQFQTLTHPGMMGTQFKTAVLEKGK